MSGGMVNVSFFGVRGSTPCPCDANGRYGGNTACVALEAPGAEPIVFDMGTGLRFWGDTLPHDGSFKGHALVTHLHWDHVQGLPFFVPVNRPGAELDVYGPCPGDDCSLGEAFGEFLRPPYFPVDVSGLAGTIRFHDVDEDDLVIGDAKVRVRSVPHVGPTNGYRVDMNSVSVAYISDHQQPLDGSFDVSDSVLELCDGVDVLIHDAQYTPAEFEQKRHWGHCTVGYAVHVAQEAGARRLVLFHHDPDHGDEFVDDLARQAQDMADGRIDEVLAAAEGLTLSVSGEAA